MQVPDLLQSPPSSPTLVAQVTATLAGQIESGILRADDLLPSERTLGKLLGVSRTVIRSATADLAARGLLEPLPGGGYRISVPSTENVSDSLAFILRDGQKGLTYAHIHSVRRLLEEEIAAVAARNRTLADLAAMENWLAVMEAEAGPTTPYCDADVAFHRSLAKATQNPLFVILLDAIADVLTDVRRTGTRLRGSVESGLRHHRAIYTAVQRQSESEAREAMSAHLADSEEIQRRVADQAKG